MSDLSSLNGLKYTVVGLKNDANAGSKRYKIRYDKIKSPFGNERYVSKSETQWN